MVLWIGGLIAAAFPVVVAALVGRGGTEGRLLRRARESLELAGEVRSMKLRSALHAAAEKDITSALELRKSTSDLVRVSVTGVISVAAAVAIPWYVSRTPAAAGGWQGPFWAVLWLVYLVMTLALGVLFRMLMRRRAKVVSD